MTTETTQRLLATIPAIAAQRAVAAAKDAAGGCGTDECECGPDCGCSAGSCGCGN